MEPVKETFQDKIDRLSFDILRLVDGMKMHEVKHLLKEAERLIESKATVTYLSHG